MCSFYEPIADLIPDSIIYDIFLKIGDSISENSLAEMNTPKLEKEKENNEISLPKEKGKSNENAVLKEKNIIFSRIERFVTRWCRHHRVRIINSKNIKLYCCSDIAAAIEDKTTSKYINQNIYINKKLADNSGTVKEMEMLTCEGVLEYMLYSRKPMAREFSKTIVKIIL